VGGLERVQEEDDVLMVEALKDLDFLAEVVQLFLRFSSIKGNKSELGKEKWREN
jgi:hypothetical protein